MQALMAACWRFHKAKRSCRFTPQIAGRWPFVTVLIALLSLALVVALADVPVWSRPIAKSERRAAVAIRDHVHPFQKWGTKLFTLPLLQEGYDRVYYLTESGRGRGHRELVAALGAALSEHDVVDLYLLAHGNRLIDWVRAIDPALRGRRRRRRRRRGLRSSDLDATATLFGARDLRIGGRP